MLIDSSYFIGEINIPNTGYADVSSSIESLIAAHEPVFLESLLGYELYKAFKASLLTGSPGQRFLDLLFGFEYSHGGVLHNWRGLVTVSSSDPIVNIGVHEDLFYRVGDPGCPEEGESSWSNPYLKDKTYRVVQRGFGPLNPNTGGDITINNDGGFALNNGVLFTSGDTFNIQITGVTVNVGQAPVSSIPTSPLADYVYYYWQRNNATNTSGIGEVKHEGVNSSVAHGANKMVYAWNRMVERLHPLVKNLHLDNAKWPEFSKRDRWGDLHNLTTRINAFNI